jgi:hypothetical protein
VSIKLVVAHCSTGPRQSNARNDARRGPVTVRSRGGRAELAQRRADEPEQPTAQQADALGQIGLACT